MTVHELRIARQYYEAISDGTKRFEIRYDDRDYRVGDYVHFLVKEGFYGSVTLTGELYRITYKLEDVPEYGLKPGYCILGLRRSRRRAKASH